MPPPNDSESTYRNLSLYMLDGYQILTVTHRNTPLKEIGRFVVPAVDDQELSHKLHALKDAFGLTELMYVATCNRVLFCTFGGDRFDAARTLEFFQSINENLDASDVQQNIKHLSGDRAVSHLYHVASSIDSLVVGEREILRQLRDDYERCRKFKLVGDHLRLLMDHAVVAAKSVYARTRIGEKPVSVVSLAIQELLRHQLPREARILLIGAGQTNNLVAKFLKKHEYRNVAVFNRTFEKAERVARITGGTAHPFDALFTYREGFDALIVCTGRQEAFVNDSLYAKLLRGDEDRKVVIDLAVPNNVDRELSDRFMMTYIEIEDLREAARANMDFRRKEVIKAEKILAHHIAEFATLYQQRRIERALRHVPRQIKEVRAHAVNELFARELEELDPQALDLVNRMMAYMERRCIGIPMQAARESVGAVSSKGKKKREQRVTDPSLASS